ncbi:mitochondrial 54s ribosomal protein 36 [Diplodia corticola]|uniref:Mitochondrial 54s ribosomal protein 36 n=1 Tax=Diplodia corticola TaxID=236234 RepID=A0A1J9R006_9PEZI|nr:mitochondrial 54s ribosomal protein 36 [Diplodia corticola]OJD34686.1 mitochondrial 54s ribosomal protein 36 [Diplodia corticola]
MPPTLTSPALTALRLSSNASALLPKTQCRHATLLRRPKRPYTFTQLITLSDGSTYLHRTTSPAPVYRSTKDIRNHPLWNPSSQKLLNIEEDEAGRLRSFRAKFGRGWDSEVTEDPEQPRQGDEELPHQGSEDNMLDLISGYSKARETNAAGERGKPVSGKNVKGSK